MSDRSSHRRVIRAIHQRPLGLPFAIWEIRNDTELSTSSVVRTVVKLVDLKMLEIKRPAYRQRHYKTAARWPQDLATAMETYELARILGI